MCLIKYQVLKTWFASLEIKFLRLEIYVDILNQASKFIAIAKRVSKTRFLIRSRVSKTRDAIFLNRFKHLLTYCIEPPHIATLQIPPEPELKL